MNQAIKEWIAKAEGDWNTARREFRVRKNPNYDAVCFHAQQCAEKYLKAFLLKKNRNIPKIHDLIELMKFCIKDEPNFEFQRDILTQLDRYSVLIRYPGEEADKDEAKLAVKSLKSFRKFVRDLGLKE